MEYVIYTCANRIGEIVLNRPEKRNALSPDLVAELKAAFQLAIQDADCKVIILRAEGKAFCAGADLQYIQNLQSFTFEENLADSESLKELFLMMHESPKVIIGQIEGAALAGGCGLASLCDLSYATPAATFGYTEVKIGFIPAMVMVFLLRKTGEGKARELLLTGKIVSAEEAYTFGLINEVVAPEEIHAKVRSVAENLIRNASANSLAQIKQMIPKVQEMPLEEALKYAALENVKARSSEDCQKGISGFLNKTPIEW